MSLSSDNFTALIYLRNQARKWKNISFLGLITIVLLSFRILFVSPDSSENIKKDGDYIANISIEGIILDNNHRTQVLEKVANQDNIKAVIVNINSPGGGIVGSEILFESLMAIKKKKPIVVLMGSLAASGGYMAAIASDYIIARNGTLTGSIGVIIQTSEFTDLASRLGVNFLTYKSSPLKGSPSPFEKSNENVDRVMNESIQDSYKFFADLVKTRRGDRLDSSKVKNIVDGRIFTGRQALKNGLVDEIGGKEAALKYLELSHKINIKKLEVRNVSIKKVEKGLLNKLLGKDTMSNIVGGFALQGGQLMSLWKTSL